MFTFILALMCGALFYQGFKQKSEIKQDFYVVLSLLVILFGMWIKIILTR